jgi:hypothetical protein
MRAYSPSLNGASCGRAIAVNAALAGPLLWITAASQVLPTAASNTRVLRLSAENPTITSVHPFGIRLAPPFGRK